MLKRLWSFRGRYRILHLTWFAFLLSFLGSQSSWRYTIALSGKD